MQDKVQDVQIYIRRQTLSKIMEYFTLCVQRAYKKTQNITEKDVELLL